MKSGSLLTFGSFKNGVIATFALVVGLLLSQASFAADVPVSDIMKDAAQLSIQESREGALLRLQQYKRTDLIRALSSVLATATESEPAPSVVYRACSMLDLKEMWPILVKRVASVDNWHLVTALTSMATNPAEQTELGAIYRKRLGATSLKAPTQMAMLDGLRHFGQPIDSKLFARKIADPSYEVRLSATQHFLATRERYATTDQIQRFKLVFALKPYEVRLAALNAYASLGEKDHRDLASVTKSKDFCKNEKNPEVKEACKRAQAAGGHQ